MKKNPPDPKSDRDIVCWVEFHTERYNQNKSKIGRLLSSLRGVSNEDKREDILVDIECEQISAKHHAERLFVAKYGQEC